MSLWVREGDMDAKYVCEPVFIQACVCACVCVCVSVYVCLRDGVGIVNVYVCECLRDEDILCVCGCLRDEDIACVCLTERWRQSVCCEDLCFEGWSSCSSWCPKCS